ncbi:hypothetical protein CYMTET_26599 [Cymbomonas tetramitiformis]|uniref:Uncharacterized protein n=1 Tax=Cymbomonas tetramitiformis TaxID=36881 RepID=A0AAE0KXV6_9CHLO|nr:hypothetical protein CYMTET_26599 [Cymbomonas tetramitiformis]|eukprot:gene33508-43047_t
MITTPTAEFADERVGFVVAPLEISCRLLGAIGNLNRVYGISERQRESLFCNRSEASPARKRPRLDVDYATDDLDAELFPDTVEQYRKAQRHAVAARIAESRSAFARFVFLNAIHVTATTAKQKTIDLPIFATIRMTAKARRESDGLAVLRYALRDDDRKLLWCGCGARCARCGRTDRVQFQLDLLDTHIDGERTLERERLRRMYAIHKKADGDDEATNGARFRRGEHRAISIDITLSCERHHNTFETYSLQFESKNPGARLTQPSLSCEGCAAYARALAAYLESAENDDDGDHRDAEIAAFHVYAVT